MTDLLHHHHEHVKNCCGLGYATFSVMSYVNLGDFGQTEGNSVHIVMKG